MANEFRDETRPEALAFPMSYPSNEMYIHQGLTKREYFAAMAMTGLLTRVPKRHGGEMDLGILECERIVDESRIMADALIKALNK